MTQFTYLFNEKILSIAITFPICFRVNRYRSQISKTYCSSKEAEAATIRSMHSNQAMETTSILSPKDRDRRSGISKGIT